MFSPLLKWDSAARETGGARRKPVITDRNIIFPKYHRKRQAKRIIA